MSLDSLKDVFLQLGSENKWTASGEEVHAKYEQDYCRLLYDEWDVCGGRRDKIVMYQDKAVSLVIRDMGIKDKNFLTYALNCEYLDEYANFLKKSKSGPAMFLGDDEWLCQGKDKKELTEILCWDDNYKDMYVFLKEHIDHKRNKA